MFSWGKRDHRVKFLKFPQLTPPLQECPKVMWSLLYCFWNFHVYMYLCFNSWNCVFIFQKRITLPRQKFFRWTTIYSITFSRLTHWTLNPCCNPIISRSWNQSKLTQCHSWINLVEWCRICTLEAETSI